MGYDNPNVWTRKAIKAERLRVLGILDLVNRDVSRAFGDKKITQDEWNTWRQEYVSSHQFATEMSNLWGSDVDVLHEREQDALKWRDLVLSRGGQVLGPKDPGHAKNKNPSSYLIPVGIGVAGIFAVSQIIKNVRK